MEPRHQIAPTAKMHLQFIPQPGQISGKWVAKRGNKANKANPGNPAERISQNASHSDESEISCNVGQGEKMWSQNVEVTAPHRGQKPSGLAT